MPTCTGARWDPAARRVIGHDRRKATTVARNCRPRSAHRRVLYASGQCAIRPGEPGVPQPDLVSTGWTSSGRCLRVVPPAGCVQRHTDEVFRLPLGAEAGRSVPAAAWVAMRNLPSHLVMDGRSMESRRDDRDGARCGASHAVLPVVPSEQRLSDDADDVFRVPRKRLPVHSAAQPRCGWIFDNMRAVSPDERHDFPRRHRSRFLPAGW